MLHRLSMMAALLVVLLPRSAGAFCGFYVAGAGAKIFNHATQVVLMRDGVRTVLSMQNNYEGPPENFAMVVPVPVILRKENVKTLPRDVFDRVEQLTAPRLVEYWEQDPCNPYPEMAYAASPQMYTTSQVSDAAERSDYGVRVEAKFAVGEYEVVILSASDSMGLEKWLRAERYQIPAGVEPYLRPYVQNGFKFFVAKVDVAKLRFENGMAMLSPLRFHYDSDNFSLPVRLGLANSAGSQDLIVHILARGQRYDVANYDNVAIPTNIEVTDAVRDVFPSFYAALFERALRSRPRAVVTEYSWMAGSCDPCPIPPLEDTDIATLGGDVIGVTGSKRRRGRGLSGSAEDFVVTRLHARYGKDTLGEDLIFRPAPPIVGGREMLSQAGKLEQGAVPSEINNFQARYIIRHPWTGSISCANPKRGVWGGPPTGGEPAAQSARNLAFASSKGIDLASLVKGELPGSNVVGPAGNPAGRIGPGGVAIPKGGGCAGCRIGGTGAARDLAWLGLGAVALLLRRGAARNRKIAGIGRDRQARLG